ncbi:peptide chain release factor N(5)-glutamine methyltransferase [Halobacillus litoralis]|uniref:peptide chain release factor N(5)-glutamine methyltransferase n=1 Tax=Halobacillus litoralis TaxID=45668 RepID=UPI001CD616E7|nr:peptide chain release factor N(5)-glutamine methyltransferase [Halobacillus litoralis]MCA0971037.1 peptide chain release factor N(5)-glutamine methyltransferase [Halobacillus litoralis]
MNNTFTTIEEARRWASVFLREKGREAQVADWLLEHYLDCSYTQLLVNGPERFPDEKKAAFVQDIEEHAETGVPVQHLIGTAPFYGREFAVDSNVLIPRPETEELVVGVIDLIREQNLSQPTVVDIGTGSGVIAVTLACESPSLNMLATDLSIEALQIAKKNAEQHGAPVTFFQGDFLEPVMHEALDVIVSNPPYIAYREKESMDDTVVDFDPELALFAEDEGLAAYQAIVAQVASLENLPSILAFEIGHEQGSDVKAIIERRLPAYEVEVRRDLNGKDRMVFARMTD